jgi:hypothetical protein
MDLYCQKCGEPWDQYGVYNGDMDPVEKDLFLKGIECPCCHGKLVCDKKIKCSDCPDHDSGKSSCNLNMVKRPFRSQIAEVLSSVLGDDTDGLAAEMEDAEMLFGKDFWS